MKVNIFFRPEEAMLENCHKLSFWNNILLFFFLNSSLKMSQNRMRNIHLYITMRFRIASLLCMLSYVWSLSTWIYLAIYMLYSALYTHYRHELHWNAHSILLVMTFVKCKHLCVSIITIICYNSHEGLKNITDLAKKATIFDATWNPKVTWDVFPESMIIKCSRHYGIHKHMASNKSC